MTPDQEPTVDKLKKSGEQREERPVLLSHDGRPLPGYQRAHTERADRRRVEDQAYTPVIIKRIDDANAHPDDVLERTIEDGLEQLQRPFFSLFLSAIAAGLILSFAAMSVAIVQGAMADSSLLMQRVAVGLVYPLGFIVCILSGTQLYTEHTATAVYPVLDSRAPILRLLRLWGLVIAGNLLGTFVGAVMIVATQDVSQISAGMRIISPHLFHFDAMPLFLSAVLAGWLMAQGAWLLKASSNSQAGRILSIYIVTMLIGIGGLHHSIAGAAEAFSIWLLDFGVTGLELGRFVLIALAGNLVGGSVFVAMLNYGHIRQTQMLS